MLLSARVTTLETKGGMSVVLTVMKANFTMLKKQVAELKYTVITSLCSLMDVPPKAAISLTQEFRAKR